MIHIKNKLCKLFLLSMLSSGCVSSSTLSVRDAKLNDKPIDFEIKTEIKSNSQSIKIINERESGIYYKERYIHLEHNIGIFFDEKYNESRDIKHDRIGYNYSIHEFVQTGGSILLDHGKHVFYMGQVKFKKDSFAASFLFAKNKTIYSVEFNKKYPINKYLSWELLGKWYRDISFKPIRQFKVGINLEMRKNDKSK